ncbi:MAG: phosphoribosyltransferase family protein [Crocinitomicaceae bacterium]
MDKQSIVLNQLQIRQKTERIALEVYENTFEETKIYIAGIEGNGFLFAEKLVDQLKKYSPQEIRLFKIQVNKSNPLDEEVSYSLPKNELKDASVVLVDDVINSGRTMIYAVKTLLSNPLKQLKVATLVNRTHRRYPVQADFVGVHISTTLKDSIIVDFGDPEMAYLE